jgi:hypothetical protein
VIKLGEALVERIIGGRSTTLADTPVLDPACPVASEPGDLHFLRRPTEPQSAMPSHSQILARCQRLRQASSALLAH